MDLQNRMETMVSWDIIRTGIRMEVWKGQRSIPWLWQTATVPLRLKFIRAMLKHKLAAQINR